MEDGLLLYAAQNDQGQGDFVALTIKDKHVEFRWVQGQCGESAGSGVSASGDTVTVAG